MRLHACTCGGDRFLGILLGIHQPAVQGTDVAAHGASLVHLLLFHVGLVVYGDELLVSHLNYLKRLYISKIDDRLLYSLADDASVGNRQEWLARQPLLERGVEHIKAT